MSRRAAATALSFENEALLTALRFSGDPVAGASQWDCIYDASDATCMAYDPRGLFLALANAVGKVSIWAVSAGRQLVRVLQVPSNDVYPNVEGSSVIICLSWSCNSRALVAGTKSGSVIVFDVSLGIVERILKPPEPLRSMRCHPSLPRIMLLLPDTGLPWICDWGSGLSWALPTRFIPDHPVDGAPSAVPSTTEPQLRHDGVLYDRAAHSTDLPDDNVHVGPGSSHVDALTPAIDLTDPEAADSMVSSAVKGKPAPSFAACFHPDRPNALYLLSSSGTLTLLSFTWEGTGSHEDGGAVVFSRTLSVFIDGVCFPPELTHSRHLPVLLVPSRSGVLLFDSNRLCAYNDALPYSEPVERTPLVSARLMLRDDYVVALPHSKSGHMSGGVYFFKRNAGVNSRFVAGPPGGLVAVETHPWLGIVVGLVSTGEVFVLQQHLGATAAVFPGPMYPPAFKLQLRNSEYLESESELDRVDENGRVLFKYPRGALARNGLQRVLVPDAGTDPSTVTDIETRSVDVCGEWRAPSVITPNFGVAPAPDSQAESAVVSALPPFETVQFSAEKRFESAEDDDPAGSAEPLTQDTAAQRRAHSQAVAVRRALSLVLGVALPLKRLRRPTREPSAAAQGRGGPDAFTPDEACMDPLAPLLLAAEPGLLLSPRRLQAVTASLDVPGTTAARGSGAPPSPLLVDPRALLAMPLLLPDAPAQELLAAQYVSLLRGPLSAALHGALSRASQPARAPPFDGSEAPPQASAAAEPPPAALEGAIRARALAAARAACSAAVAAASAARSRLSAPYDPPPPPPPPPPPAASSAPSAGGDAPRPAGRPSGAPQRRPVAAGATRQRVRGGGAPGPGGAAPRPRTAAPAVKAGAGAAPGGPRPPPSSSAGVGIKRPRPVPAPAPAAATLRPAQNGWGGAAAAADALTAALLDF